MQQDDLAILIGQYISTLRILRDQEDQLKLQGIDINQLSKVVHTYQTNLISRTRVVSKNKESLTLEDAPQDYIILDPDKLKYIIENISICENGRLRDGEPYRILSEFVGLLSQNTVFTNEQARVALRNRVNGSSLSQALGKLDKVGVVAKVGLGIWKKL